MRRTAPLVLVWRPRPRRRCLSGCENTVDLRGFAATPGSVEKLEVGAQSREDVVRLIGSPSAVATFNPNVWYYISETQEYWAFTKPRISAQKVIQVTFNESGRIEAIKNYDLKDAQDIQMVQRITPTSGKELTILEQVLGNVGRFSGPQADQQPRRADRRRRHPTLAIRNTQPTAKEKAPVLRPGLFRLGVLRPLSAPGRRGAAAPRCW